MKKIKKNIQLILFIFLLFITFFSIQNVKADSGWDTSYDSGSSWSSDSSWDSGSSWDWDTGHDWDHDRPSSSGTNNSIGQTYGIVVFFIELFIIVLIISKILKNADNSVKKIIDVKTNDREKYQDISSDKLKDITPNLTIGYLKQNTYNKFIEIQNAWMDFDYEKLRELCTDELYNSYISQLDTLKLKNGKNIMSDFELNYIRIYDIKLENNNIVIQVYMNVTFYDYVINEKTQQVIRGNKNNKITNSYLMTFIRDKNDLIKDINCPNCGAPINNNASNKCEYCDSTIVKSSSDFVLSKKTNINQN